jgi:hypothetical protein
MFGNNRSVAGMRTNGIAALGSSFKGVAKWIFLSEKIVYQNSTYFKLLNQVFGNPINNCHFLRVHNFC